MKKLIFTILILILTSITASSQLVYERIGGDTTYGATGDNYAYSYYKNSGTEPVYVRFRRIVNVLPNPQWTSSICVGVCYADFIDVVPLKGDSALRLIPGEQDTMDITFLSPNIGIARVVMRMYNEYNVNQYVDRNFILNVNSVGIHSISTIAENYSLGQNYPNPFNPTTNINFSIPKQEKVSLRVYDILGNEVDRLIDNENLNAGSYKIDFAGNKISSGIYYYTLNTESFTDTKKMILLK